MSTNKTKNYQLHLWEPGDDFLREEFNENNAKVDAALKAQAEELDSAVAEAKQTAASALAAYKTSNDVAVAEVRRELTAQLDAALDTVMYREKLKKLVTSADTSKYSIDLSGIDFSRYWALEIYVEGVSSSDGCYVYLNDASGSGYYRTTSTTQSVLAHFYMGTAENPKRNYNKLTLFCGTSLVNVLHQRIGETTGESRLCTTAASGITWDNLTEVTLGPYAEGVLQSGLTVTIYGVRK